MELVDGPSLAARLASGPLDPGDALDVVAQTAAALYAAHQVGLVHRDIKPPNILLGPGGVVKITDFGIAHVAGSAPITRTGMLAGTPAYVAPERLTGAPATPASDLYSLGVVAYECLSGAPPFTGPPLEIAAAHQHRPLPPLPAAAGAAVAALVAELTAKDPAARPASAARVAERAAGLRDHARAATGRPHSDTQVSGSGHREQPVTLAELPQLGPPGAGRSGREQAWRGLLPDRAQPWLRWERPGRRLGIAVAVAAVALLSGLIGWVFAGALGAASAQHPGAAQASAPTARMVYVSSALVGQPVGAVIQQLRQLGLKPRVLWTPGDQQPPGSVVSLDPRGEMPAGSTVTVTAALQDHGRSDHGHGNGQGNDNGGG
jgi:serine/threonine-protein kinase